MDADKAAENLNVIRQLMERPVRYSTMSGLSGILAGCAALAGVALDSYISGSYDDRRLAMWINAGVWAGVFLVAFLGVTSLTAIRERRQRIPFWSAAKRRILMTILPPFVAGVGLTAAVMYRWHCQIGPNEWGLIPAIWMCFYGVTCWEVGGFSITEIRVMGAAFILAGLLSAAFFQYTIPGLEPGTAPYWTLGLTFGGFHIIYGIVVWIRHGG